MGEPSETNDRLYKLRQILHSLSTRIPKVILKRVEELHPSLMGKATVTLVKCGGTSLVTEDQEQIPGTRDFEEDEAVTEPDLLMCLRCKAKFSSAASLTKHSELHRIHRVFVCKICDKGFNILMELRAHSLAHSKRSFECKICKTRFKTKFYLKKHHLLHSYGRFMCYICDKTFNDEEDLDTHSMIHDKPAPFKCNFCGKCSRSKVASRKHLRMHTDARRFSCKICNKRFLYKDRLFEHVDSHG